MLTVLLAVDGRKLNVIAAEAGIDKSTLSKFQTKERTPTRAQAESLARVLKCTVDEIYDELDFEKVRTFRKKRASERAAELDK